jgi:hypothetical protein
MMQNFLKFSACVLVLWASTATATSPCAGDACIDEASASFIAPYDFFEAKCSSANPGMHAQYAAVLAYFLRDVDTDFLKKLRVSKPYAHVLAEIESKANSLSTDELGKACDAFSKEPQGPTNQSTRTR